MTTRSRLTLTALTLVAAGAFAPQAQASGFQLREQSPSSQGNAFAGISAGGNDISALFFNPAVMTQYSGNSFSLGATYIGLDVKFTDGSGSRTPVLTGLGFNVLPGGGSPLPINSSSNGQGNSGVSAAVPEFNIMHSLNDRWKVGLSINVPFGLSTEYDANWVGRYHALKTDLKTFDFSPSVAYKVNDQFSVGAAFIARYADATLTNAVDYGTALALEVGGALAAAGVPTTPLGPGQNSAVANIAMGAPNATFGTPGYAIPGAWDGKAGLKGDGWGYGFKVGATFNPTSDLRIGLAYQSAMSMTLKGNATFEFPAAMPSTDLAALNSAGLRNGKGQADLDLPATASVGFTWKAGPVFTLGGEVARTTWSRFKTLVVKFDTGAPDNITNEDWHDTTFVSVGGTWRLDPVWTLRAGAAYDQGAVDTYRATPRIPDNNRTWASLGLSYAWSRNASVDVGYTHLFIPKGRVELSAGTSPSDPNAVRGSLYGDIKATIDIFGVQMHYRF